MLHFLSEAIALNSKFGKNTKSGGESSTRAYWTYKLDNATGPVAQFRMAQLIDYDRRLTEPARMVYRFMIGWYMHAKHGDALASVRHIVSTMRGRAPDGARHLSRSAVQRAIILLIESGWLVRTYTGRGRGGSRYVPVLNVLELASQGTLPEAESRSVPEHRDTTDISLASHFTGTALSHSTGTLIDLASHSTGTKTLLLDPSTDGVTEREIDHRPPTAPPLADGLAATAAARTAVEECTDTKPTFELCWRTYGYNRGKKAARAAWNALPAEVDRAAVIHAAAEWQASWAAQGKPDAPRKHLATWLADELYDEDAPKGFTKPTKAKTTELAPSLSKTDIDQQHTCQVITITDAMEVQRGDYRYLRVLAENFEHSLIVEAPTEHEQQDHQRKLQRFIYAAGLDGDIQDANEVVGRTLEVTWFGDTPTFSRSPANDNSVDNDKAA